MSSHLNVHQCETAVIRVFEDWGRVSVQAGTLSPDAGVERVSSIERYGEDLAKSSSSLEQPGDTQGAAKQTDDSSS